MNEERRKPFQTEETEKPGQYVWRIDEIEKNGNQR